MRQKKFCPYCGDRLITRQLEGRLRLFCGTCREPVYENPTPAACVIVADKDAILLVKRSVAPKIGAWCLPGGFIELGEHPEAAALRELREETGLAGKIDRLIGATCNPSSQYHTVTLVCYQITSYKGQTFAGDDASDVRFFHIDELPEVAFESHKEFIRIYSELMVSAG